MRAVARDFFIYGKATAQGAILKTQAVQTLGSRPSGCHSVSGFAAASLCDKREVERVT